MEFGACVRTSGGSGRVGGKVDVLLQAEGKPENKLLVLRGEKGTVSSGALALVLV